MDFNVDPDQLRAQGARLEDLGTSAGSELRGLRDAVAGDGAPWGMDEEGSIFGAAYTEMSALAEQVLEMFTDGIETVGHNLQVMADDLQDADNAAGEELGSIARLLEQP